MRFYFIVNIKIHSSPRQYNLPIDLNSVNKSSIANTVSKSIITYGLSVYCLYVQKTKTNNIYLRSFFYRTIK